MLFPMMGADVIPTEFAIKMRAVFIGTLVLLVALVIGKFVISDWWSGISLLFLVAVGALCCTGEYGVNMINFLVFCIMAIICAIFEVVAAVMYFMHSKYSIFDSKAPTMVLVAQSVFIATPLMIVLSGGIAYLIYADCRDRGQEAPSPPGMYSDYGYGYGGTDYGPPPPRQQPQTRPQQRPAFPGSGHRLGAPS